MRFFKKFFSIGSKRSKNRDPCAQSLPPVQDHLNPSYLDDAEAAVSRLLRSSSGRLAAELHTGLGSLPPLPHPIDSVVPPPKSSSTTLASLSARSTYSVTIHSRNVHSRTEFPNAYPPMDVSFTSKRSLTDSPRRRSKSVPITPRDKSRLLALRQDPSVATLLNHYDDEGHLSSTIFSNTPSPQKEGRVQRRHTGSTLRQLLGHSSSPGVRNSSTEGDISWAEKFLGEIGVNSSVSSIGPLTPADTHFIHTHSTDDKAAPPVECDTSAATFSSLEVELSVSTDLTHPQIRDSSRGNPMSPQHASQIFGFLDDKRTRDGPVSRLPQLKTTTPHYRRFSGESSVSDTTHSYILPPHLGSTHISQPISPTTRQRYSITSDGSRSLPPSPTAAAFLLTQYEKQESAPPQSAVVQHTEPSVRELRGPCPSFKISSQQSPGCLSPPFEVNDSHLMTEQPLRMQSVFGEKSNIDNKHVTVTVARPCELHSQIPKLKDVSGSSCGSAETKYESAVGSPRRQPAPLQPPQMKRCPTEAGLSASVALHGKENDVVSRLPQPVTPIRPFSFRSHLLEPPSPASSSELSPVAKQMMANLRQQRLHARQRERQAGRLGGGQSRIRY